MLTLKAMRREIMTAERQSQTVDAATLPPEFILPDPPRIPDMLQRDQLTRAMSSLITHFDGRDDVLVAGDGYVRHDPTNESERYAPDCVVTFGVDAKAIIKRNGYLISEAGKPPDFVLEVASKSTGERDYKVKRDGYAKYRAKQYWRFDETGGRWHDAPLAGDALVDGEYVPIEITQDEDGRPWGYSEVLDLYLCWDDGVLRFFDPKTDRFLPDQPETKRERDAAVVERNVARVERDTAMVERDEAIGERNDAVAERDEAVAERDEAIGERDDAVAERDEIAAENERLRERLRQAGIDE